MIAWAWAEEFEVYKQMLQVWHKSMKQWPWPPKRFSTWDNDCGAALEQAWADAQGLGINATTAREGADGK